MNVVFLDIDGVLQPYDNELRFANVDKSIIQKLSEKHNIDYSQYSFYDVYAVYYDWDEQAVSRLKYVLDETDSKIIVSSDWRTNRLPNKMKDLLAIQDLDKYYYADNIIIKEYLYTAKKRALEIKNSLEIYDINNFVVLDDMKGLEEYFPNNIVQTHDHMTISDMKKCIKILKM